MPKRSRGSWAATAGAAVRQGTRWAKRARPFVKRVTRIIRKVRRGPKSQRRRLDRPAKGSRRGDLSDVNQQWIKQRKTSGSTRSRRFKTNKIVQSNIERLIYFYKGMDANFDGAFGYFPMDRLLVSSTYNTPFYLFNLTACTNSGYNTSPFYRLFINSLNDSYNWMPQTGQNGAGSSDSLLQVRDSTNTAALSGPGGKSYLDWARIRLNVYGQSNRPTRFLARIVTFKDDNVRPEQHFTTRNDEINNQFWGQQLKPNISNPIAMTDQVNKNLMTVLASKEVVINPKLTTDVDTDPDIRTIDWFYRMNKTLDYTGGWRNELPLGTSVAGIAETAITVTDASINLANPNGTNFGNRPKLGKDNVYLLLSAVNYTHSPVTVDATTCPSFDMAIETCHKIMDNY